MLAWGSAWLDTTHRAVNSRLITYQQGTLIVSQVPAQIGATEFERTDLQANIVQKTESRDFLIFNSDLAANGVALEPRPGDLITETDATGTWCYEVFLPDGEQAAKQDDRYRNCWRIHTQARGAA
jgi:hypothetical protein